MEQEPTDGSQSPNSQGLKNRKPRARKPRKATPKSLENAAHYHLRRFASSSDNLRRVLGRRVERSARAHGGDGDGGRDGGRAAIEEIIARFERAGLLDDAAYARRRRLGPYRPAEARAERRTKDLAALARTGFGYSVALRVIDAEEAEELEREASRESGQDCGPPNKR
jgi:regulatory protein